MRSDFRHPSVLNVHPLESFSHYVIVPSFESFPLCTTLKIFHFFHLLKNLRKDFFPEKKNFDTEPASSVDQVLLGSQML